MRRVCCVLLPVVVAAAAPGALAEDLRPGMALPPDQLSPEAAQYEPLLQSEDTPANDAVLPGDDTGEKRRHFDDRPFHVGFSLGMGLATPSAGSFLELNVWDRLALGAEAAISPWGPAAALYLRGRPLVWGGRGRGLLNAVTVQAAYRYMAYGDEGLSFCVAECDRPSFIAMPAHFVVLEAGFEHAFAGGFTLRYAWGAALQLAEPAWRCRVARQLVPCADERPPTDTFFLTGVSLNHALP